MSARRGSGSNSWFSLTEPLIGPPARERWPPLAQQTLRLSHRLLRVLHPATCVLCVRGGKAQGRAVLRPESAWDAKWKLHSPGRAVFQRGKPESAGPRGLGSNSFHITSLRFYWSKPIVWPAQLQEGREINSMH